MKIKIGRSFSKEFNITEEIILINNIENNLNVYFTERQYGDSIEQIFIGLICVSKDFDIFFPLSEKVKVNRNPPEVEYGVKLEFSHYITLDKSEKEKYIYSEILKRSEFILETKILKGFNKNNFLIDLRKIVLDNIGLIS